MPLIYVLSVGKILRGLWKMSKIMEYQNTMLCGELSGGYSTKTPCISKDDSIPEWLRKNVEKKLRDCLKG